MSNEESDGDKLTTDSFLVTCRQAGLHWDDMEVLTIGMCLDFIDEYIEQNKDEKEKKRTATQEDFDSF